MTRSGARSEANVRSDTTGRTGLRRLGKLAVNSSSEESMAPSSVAEFAAALGTERKKAGLSLRGLQEAIGDLPARVNPVEMNFRTLSELTGSGKVRLPSETQLRTILTACRTDSRRVNQLLAARAVLDESRVTASTSARTLSYHFRSPRVIKQARYAILQPTLRRFARFKLGRRISRIERQTRAFGQLCRGASGVPLDCGRCMGWKDGTASGGCRRRSGRTMRRRSILSVETRS